MSPEELENHVAQLENKLDELKDELRELEGQAAERPKVLPNLPEEGIRCHWQRHHDLGYLSRDEQATLQQLRPEIWDAWQRYTLAKLTLDALIETL